MHLTSYSYTAPRSVFSRPCILHGAAYLRVGLLLYGLGGGFYRGGAVEDRLGAFLRWRISSAASFIPSISVAGGFAAAGSLSAAPIFRLSACFLVVAFYWLYALGRFASGRLLVSLVHCAG